MTYSCESCVDKVKKSLENVHGVKSIDVDLQKGSVVVESSLPVLDLQQILEATGRSVAIKGYDGSIAAVSILEAGNKNIKGVVRFIQATPDTCIIDGTIDGLTTGTHSIEVHENGDLSRGCESIGEIFNPENDTGKRKYGYLGSIIAERNGRADFRLEDNVLKLSDVIGRSFVVTSKVEGICQQCVACGIIARSAGLFQNPKTICACDGTTIWDEVSKPSSKSSL